MHYPKDAFLNFARKLKDDGIIVFETGNIGGISKRWIKFIGRLSYPEHIYLYSEGNIKKLLLSTGFTFEVRYYHTVVLSIILKRIFNAIKAVLKMLNIRKSEGASDTIALSQDISRESGSPLDKIKGNLIHVIMYRLSRAFPHTWPSSIIFIAKKRIRSSKHLAGN